VRVLHESIPTLIATAQNAAGGAGTTPTRQGLALLSIVILLGVVLLVCSGAMLILNARRRLRRRVAPKKPSFATPDPWKESAARMPAPDYQEEADQDRPHG
tara:strand:- start:163 stop:465 length:303 start_codon:yes stop_codon:yes gene_type:complete